MLPAFCLLFTGFTSIVRADNWPQWRGPQRNGISTATSIPVEWSSENNVAWRAPMPGQGGATPAVWGDSMFVTSADGDDLVLLCLDSRNGAERWRRTVTSGNQDARAGEGNSASPSPSTDGQHVWVFFSTGVLACYDFQGEEQWKFDVGERFGKIDIQFGMASTPLLVDNHLYLQLIHGVLNRGDDTRSGQVIKLDKLSGKTVWVQERITQAGFECKQSYASPVLYDDGQQRFVIAHGADCTTGHSLDTGEELWRLSGLNGPSDINTRYDDTFRFVASPAVAPGWIIVPTAKAGPLVALRVNDQLKGDVSSNPAVLRWHLSETPDVSIPLIVDDLVYLLHKDGKLQCVELATGKELYHQRTHTVQHRSSPVYADGRIYFCGKDGVCTVVKAGRDFEILAENEMNGEPITASPIIANDTLFLRTYAAVYAIRK
ncbi:MAG: PQQ-binding-like beta-propeller repeat protein [Planctomycetales bacterium]|nr:PQQ-binding-like beta-propeller repeat protein [Planctomycetales bacterium]